MVWTPAIRDEWNRHQSRFARTVRVGMVARKKLCFMDVTHDASLLQRIEGTATSANQVNIVRKDFHLIEAALATDHTVVSLDDAARVVFKTAVASVMEVK